MTTCQCGEPYAATTDGRQRHRLIFEHTPVAQGNSERRVNESETCDNRGNAKAAPTSQVVEHLSRGLTPNKEGL